MHAKVCHLFWNLLGVKAVRSAAFFPLICFTALALFLQSGCAARSDRPDLGEVTGTVTLDGKPLADALLTFVPERGRSSFGATDEAGFYRLKYTGDFDGAVLGQHKVVIESIVASGNHSDPSIERNNSAQVEKIPRKYNTRSELKREVVAGSNAFDFELTSR
ncbi:carboxypeptidase regulatory-like domain-containing protein [Blastopirellula sp. J2-11]|uniref:carboxypeptidase regulatory-like domain-containing protein n=1 Tax=Blastopirellula sp. J2-11 TaxID=2943192 RepID=UPI0021C81DC4|nr:carboxypeptidase regulatory-like domain-containing protein [Blastopirellula sp. J2-11]UUO05449.1 carboxypeptidase regulatory-like domain-containing protein [Blastopirellula sp. J2-11]